ncbi:hypothetical protein LTSERUB_4975 [Salmonella enterica subsp. enterica serovar Rubislaw str. A4-653]|uniref:Uncharacterized protein n=1 Tax=Salmonella enterica subsp. enterica serovar Rubislaw str. A4-653 TaxID=913081 RepID=G5QPM0_SALRU|nr:hypothetical protein LTSERUB_4975 [Salmonella enterica subsp. enterica serovar Rubislaw str. A4-653]
MVELTLNGLLCMPVFAPSCIEEGRGWQVGTSGCGAKSGRPEIERVQCFLDSITLRFPCLICHEFAPVISQSQRHFFLCKRIKVCEFFLILLKQSVFQRHLRTDFVELVMPVVFLTKVFAQPEHTEILLRKNGAGIYPVVFFRDKSVKRTAFVTDNRFVGLPLLIFSIVFIPPIFIGVHILFLVLVNLVLLTERSDRCRETLRSENDLSVIGIIRPAVVSSTPFYFVFSVLYFSGVICSVVTSDSLLAIGGEV